MKYKYYCNPWDKSNICKQSKYFGYNDEPTCLEKCPYEKSKLWFILTNTYKLLYPGKYSNQNYIDTYSDLKRYALTLQQLSKTKNIPLLDILINKKGQTL